MGVTARSLTPNHKLVTVSLDAAAASFPFDTPAVCMHGQIRIQILEASSTNQY